MINIIYDYLILSTVNIILKRNVRYKKILLGSFIGSLSIMDIVIPRLNNIYITILLSILMVIITFGFKDLIYVKNNLIYFYMVCTIFGGFVYFVNIKLGKYFINISNYDKKIIINFFCIIFISPFIYFIYVYLYKNNKIKHDNYYQLKVSLNNNLHEVNAFYDTGNLIKDPYKGRCVILIDEDILYGDIKNKSPILVPCHMINNSFILKCYKPNLLIINNKVIDNCLIGLFNAKLYDGVKGIISGYLGDKIK